MEHNMNWGRPRSALSGGFVELNAAERKKLKDKELDVRVAQAAVVGQERELRRIEKRFDTVSKTERNVMHDYRKKYLNEKRQQKMYEAELRDDNFESLPSKFDQQFYSNQDEAGVVEPNR